MRQGNYYSSRMAEIAFWDRMMHGVMMQHWSDRRKVVLCQHYVRCGFTIRCGNVELEMQQSLLRVMMKWCRWWKCCKVIKTIRIGSVLWSFLFGWVQVSGSSCGMMSMLYWYNYRLLKLPIPEVIAQPHITYYVNDFIAFCSHQRAISAIREL